MIIELIGFAVVVCHKVIVPCLIWSTGSLYFGLRQISAYQTRKPSQTRTQNRQVPTSIPAQPSHAINSPPAQPQSLPSGWVKPETRERLFAMCGGDEKLVQRLTGGSGCQSDWEKAIYYLERDRR